MLVAGNVYRVIVPAENKKDPLDHEWNISAAIRKSFREWGDLDGKLVVLAYFDPASSNKPSTSEVFINGNPDQWFVIASKHLQSIRTQPELVAEKARCQCSSRGLLLSGCQCGKG